MPDNRTVGAYQARDLVRVAFGPATVALVVIAAVVLLQLLIANSDMTGALGATASIWLGSHGVPIAISGREIGTMPLLPILLMVWGTARTTAAATDRTTSWLVIRWIAASAVGGPLLIAAVALAVVHDASSVLTQLQTPSALTAFGCVLAVHAVGAVLGIGSKVGKSAVAALPLPVWVSGVGRGAAAGVLALFGLSGAVTALSLLTHWSTMTGLYGITDSLFGQLSLTLLSILYIPNVIVGASAIAVGSSAHVGFATFSAFTVFGGDIPALPVLAAVPTPPLGPIWVALLIIGAAAGVALGQQCALRPLPWLPALARVAAAALLAAIIMVGLGIAASGPLGNFGDVGVDQSTFGPAVFLWLFSVGAATVVMAGGLARAPKRVTVQPAEHDDPAPPVDAPVDIAEEPFEEHLFEDEPETNAFDAVLPDDGNADVDGVDDFTDDIADDLMADEIADDLAADDAADVDVTDRVTAPAETEIEPAAPIRPRRQPRDDRDRFDDLPDAEDLWDADNDPDNLSN